MSQCVKSLKLKGIVYKIIKAVVHKMGIWGIMNEKRIFKKGKKKKYFFSGKSYGGLKKSVGKIDFSKMLLCG